MKKNVIDNFLKFCTDPEVTMLDEGSNKFAKAGSNFNLTCFIRQTSEERKFLKWTHDDQVLS